MEFAIRMFFMLFFEAFKRYWYITGIPVIAVLIHGAYTGSWYIGSGIIASCVISAGISLNEMNQPG